MLKGGKANLKKPESNILTLQKLTSIANYEELNSKSDDDFIPSQFGFDLNPPVPGRLLHLQEVIEEDSDSQPPTKIELNLPHKKTNPAVIQSSPTAALSNLKVPSNLV